jgi:C4-dicarboxylate-specific signal transduction histidine kinase
MRLHRFITVSLLALAALIAVFFIVREFVITNKVERAVMLNAQPKSEERIRFLSGGVDRMRREARLLADLAESRDIEERRWLISNAMTALPDLKEVRFLTADDLNADSSDLHDALKVLHSDVRSIHTRLDLEHKRLSLHLMAGNTVSRYVFDADPLVVQFLNAPIYEMKLSVKGESIETPRIAYQTDFTLPGASGQFTLTMAPNKTHVKAETNLQAREFALLALLVLAVTLAAISSLTGMARRIITQSDELEKRFSKHDALFDYAKKSSNISTWEYSPSTGIRWDGSFYGRMGCTDKGSFDFSRAMTTQSKTVWSKFLESLQNSTESEGEFKLMVRNCEGQTRYFTMYFKADSNGAYGIALDNTDQLEAERHLQQTAKLAEMGNMLDSILHQWNQPLTAIGAIAGNIKLGALTGSIGSDDLVDDANAIDGQIAFMKQTAEGFRDFMAPAKPDSSFSLQESVERIKLILSHRINKLGVTVNSEVGDTLLEGPQNEFDQVLLNLFNNAFDQFAAAQTLLPAITVKAYTEGGEKLIVIEDNGGGIPEETLPRLFEPRFTTKGEHGGSGIGLDICHKIVWQSFKGSIGADNGKSGARFIIRL